MYNPCMHFDISMSTGPMTDKGLSLRLHSNFTAMCSMAMLRLKLFCTMKYLHRFRYRHSEIYEASCSKHTGYYAQINEYATLTGTESLPSTEWSYTVSWSTKNMMSLLQNQSCLCNDTQQHAVLNFHV